MIRSGSKREKENRSDVRRCERDLLGMDYCPVSFREDDGCTSCTDDDKSIQQRLVMTMV